MSRFPLKIRYGFLELLLLNVRFSSSIAVSYIVVLFCMVQLNVFVGVNVNLAAEAVVHRKYNVDVTFVLSNVAIVMPHIVTVQDHVVVPVCLTCILIYLAVVTVPALSTNVPVPHPEACVQSLPTNVQPAAQVHVLCADTISADHSPYHTAVAELYENEWIYLFDNINSLLP